MMLASWKSIGDARWIGAREGSGHVQAGNGTVGLRRRHFGRPARTGARIGREGRYRLSRLRVPGRADDCPREPGPQPRSRARLRAEPARADAAGAAGLRRAQYPHCQQYGRRQPRRRSPRGAPARSRAWLARHRLRGGGRRRCRRGRQAHARVAADGNRRAAGSAAAAHGLGQRLSRRRHGEGRARHRRRCRADRPGRRPVAVPRHRDAPFRLGLSGLAAVSPPARSPGICSNARVR